MKTKYAEILGKWNVVAVIASEADLQEARLLHTTLRRKERAQIDLFEIRLDKLAGSGDWKKGILEFVQANPKTPIILTVRDASEGGAQNWSSPEREDLYMEFLPYATFIDIEASTVRELIYVAGEAHHQGVGLIVSHHNFGGVTSAEELLRHAVMCYRVEGAIFKVAMTAVSPQEYLDFQAVIFKIKNMSDMSGGIRFKVASMVMQSPYAQISRYLDIINGGSLIYGSLNDTVVPGQPRALNIRRDLEIVLGFKG